FHNIIFHLEFNERCLERIARPLGNAQKKVFIWFMKSAFGNCSSLFSTTGTYWCVCKPIQIDAKVLRLGPCCLCFFMTYCNTKYTYKIYLV
ncbi:hypothetical protein B0A58_15755, partial [Flavobacterium branchiophilum NBRC 15030 = ATCC 35035]